MTLIVVLGAFFLCAVRPFVLGLLFLGVLLLRAILVGLLNGFLGLILFIVYVGGTIVLFSYCFILSPKPRWRVGKLYPLALLRGGATWFHPPAGGAGIEFY